MMAGCGAPAPSTDAGHAEDARGPSCEPQPEPRAPVVEPGSLTGIDPTPAPGCSGQWVIGVRGHVQDPSGAPLPGTRTQICVVPVGGSLLCLAPPTTDDGGDFEVPIGEPSARCAERMTMRVLLPGAIDATSYCELELTPESSVIELAEPITVYPVERPACLPPEGDESAPRTITFPSGLELVDLRPEQITGYDELAAAPHDLSGDCLSRRAPDGGFLATWGFRPEVDVEDGVAVRIPNSTGLAPGTHVDLYVLGGLATRLSDGTPLEEGEWGRYGTGTVTSDGGAIESDPGALLTTLTWIGYRLP